MEEFEKTKIATKELREFKLTVIVERGFPAGAVKMHCPVTGCHAVGEDEKIALERLKANILLKEGDAWVR